MRMLQGNTVHAHTESNCYFEHMLYPGRYTVIASSCLHVRITGLSDMYMHATHSMHVAGLNNMHTVSNTGLSDKLFTVSAGQ